MRFCRNDILPGIMAIAIAIFVFKGVSHAQQFSVSISGPSSPIMVPTGTFNVSATASNVPSTLDKIVFYRNDVPYKTVSGPSLTKTIQQNLGQDTYTYRARAYDLNGTWTESSDYKLIVQVPSNRVFRMGEPIGQQSSTNGPSRFFDHTDQITAAVTYIGNTGGGTLYFPCTQPFYPSTHYPPNIRDVSIYNISRTITIPSNVTLQGESSEDTVGRCRIYWNSDVVKGNSCIDAPSLRGIPVFKVAGNTHRVRFRDLWILSRTRGRDCGSFGTSSEIENDETTAIELNAEGNSISDIVFENVSMTAFTYGISALDGSISDIKMRGVRPTINHRQLHINANAYGWDVQNFNINTMKTNQGGVEIINAGAPSGVDTENKKLKFLQLNCNGDGDAPYLDRPKFCVSVKKHGGLYFKQLHYEGTQQSFQVESIAGTNAEPIVLEGGAATGLFEDDSMILYLIGNSIIAAPDPQTAQIQLHKDKKRLEFSGGGLSSTVVDCGDVHWDRTDTLADNDPSDAAEWGDWRMLYTHTERNRGSFFLSGGNYTYVKPRTTCPENIANYGGEHFDTGVLPVDTAPPATDPNRLDPSDCYSTSNCTQVLQDLLNADDNHGTIYINGTIVVDQTIEIPSGRQLVGIGSNPELVLSDPEGCMIFTCPPSAQRLLQINVPVGNDVLPRTSSIVIRNLKLTTTQSHTTASGLAIIGANDKDFAGTSSDMHFSGLTIEGFDKGLEVVPFNTEEGRETTHPMIDGLSWKNIRFVNNQTAASLFSSNLSNWNIINLSMESNSEAAVGWHQITGLTSIQNVTCLGATAPNNMEHCIKLDVAFNYLTGLKQTQNVTNSLTIGENYHIFDGKYASLQFSSIVLRNNDFRSSSSGMGGVKIDGKAFIVSMNNNYQHFSVSSDSEANLSRVTYCGDNFLDADGDLDIDDDDRFYGLAERHPNLYVGVPTLTRVECGARPFPWDDPVKWGAETKNIPNSDAYHSDDIPLTGNFFDDIKEDFVIFRPDILTVPNVQQSQFRIRKAGAGAGEPNPPDIIYNWGLKGDIPMTGKFIPNQRSQMVVWRPSTGQWYSKDPDVSGYSQWGFGLPCATVPYPDPDDPNINCDVPFIGNFIKDVNPFAINDEETPDMDEIAIYRPSSREIWIFSPQFSQPLTITRPDDYGSRIQVGDFRGLGYDQIAQIKNGVWTIYDPRDPGAMLNTGVISYESGDERVAGKYLPGVCTQIAVWRPSTQKFIVKDPPFSNCGGRPETSIIWGSNNDFQMTNYPDDIPLTIRVNTQQYGPLDKPVAYRPTKGAFEHSISNGQWWVHDRF